MNNKTALLDLLMRRQRNRKIRNIIFAMMAAGVIGWVLTYSQQRAFSLTPPVPSVIQSEIQKKSTAPQMDEVAQPPE